MICSRAITLSRKSIIFLEWKSLLQTSSTLRIDFDELKTPRCNLDKVSNKKISRLESDIELETKDHKSRLINRNPMNLENLSFERKPAGFWWDEEMPTHYHKLVFEQSAKYLTATLVHWSGRKLIQASTKEPQLLKYYTSPNTSQAATILAQVMARRCLQSGYITTTVDEHVFSDSSGLKVRTFFEAVKANGINFDISPEIQPRAISDI